MDSCKIIDEREINVVIKDHNMPRLSFVDLPGIRTFPEDQRIITENIAKKYMSQPDTLIIYVVSATIPRLTSCVALGLIKTCNKESQTLITLTKCDLLDNSNIEPFLIERLSGKTDEIDISQFAGINAVVNRNTMDKSLVTNDKDELKFFKQYHLHCGIKVLLESIDNVYSKYINTTWIPRTIEQMDVKIKECDKENDEIGQIEFNKEEQNKIHTYFKFFIVHIWSPFSNTSHEETYCNNFPKDYNIDVKHNYQWNHIQNIQTYESLEWKDQLNTQQIVQVSFNVASNGRPIPSISTFGYLTFYLKQWFDKKYLYNELSLYNSLENLIKHSITTSLKNCIKDLFDGKIDSMIYFKLYRFDKYLNEQINKINYNNVIQHFILAFKHHPFLKYLKIVI